MKNIKTFNNTNCDLPQPEQGQVGKSCQNCVHGDGTCVEIDCGEDHNWKIWRSKQQSIPTPEPNDIDEAEGKTCSNCGNNAGTSSMPCLKCGGVVTPCDYHLWQPIPPQPVQGETSTALSNILYERKLQDAKWGEQNHHPEKWIVILLEELGEASKALLEQQAVKYRDELVHATAVGLAAIEAFDRNKPGQGHTHPVNEFCSCGKPVPVDDRRECFRKSMEMAYKSNAYRVPVDDKSKCVMDCETNLPVCNKFDDGERDRNYHCVKCDHAFACHAQGEG